MGIPPYTLRSDWKPQSNEDVIPANVVTEGLKTGHVTVVKNLSSLWTGIINNPSILVIEAWLLDHEPGMTWLLLRIGHDAKVQVLRANPDSTLVDTSPIYMAESAWKAILWLASQTSMGKLEPAKPTTPYPNVVVPSNWTVDLLVKVHAVDGLSFTHESIIASDLELNVCSKCGREHFVHITIRQKTCKISRPLLSVSAWACTDPTTADAIIQVIKLCSAAVVR